MRAKVVILNWNGREHLQRFLPSVIEHTPSEVGIVVADNGSDDDSIATLERDFPSVSIIRLEKNHGFAQGYNLALGDASLSDCDCFILLNSDVETPAGWCEPLLARLVEDSNLAAIAPKILQIESRDMFEYAGAAGGYIDGLGYPFCRGRILSTLEPDKGQYDDFREVFWATGACMAVRADIFRELGGFDGDFFAHMEEIDLCWRMQSRGYKIAVEPASKVYHLGGGTLATTSPFKTYLNHRNNLSMLYKNLSGRSLFFVLSARLILDGFSGIAYLLSGKPRLSWAILKAHFHFYGRLGTLSRKRRAIKSQRLAKSRNIYQGSIILRYMFGKRTFGDLIKR